VFFGSPLKHASLQRPTVLNFHPSSAGSPSALAQTFKQTCDLLIKHIVCAPTVLDGLQFLAGSAAHHIEQALQPPQIFYTIKL
jgi:hypothetical protein